jgi:hypothetical protein
LDDYNSIRRAQLLVIPGHSEYWTMNARKNFDRFVNNGKNAIILSGNTMWWQVRYDKSKQQMICYKSMNDDPVKSSRHKTINWNDSVLQYPIITSIGVDFSLAGYGLKVDKGWNGYKLLLASPLLENTTLRIGDVIPCPSDEYDGAPLAGVAEGKPVLDYERMGFFKAEVIGFDFASRGGKDGVATWIVFKPTRSSGTVINTASTDWCSWNGIGQNDDIIRITFNMIDKMLRNGNVFSTDQVAPALN